MLEVLSNFINCLITAIIGFYLIRTIIKKECKITNIKTILLLCTSAVITAYLQNNEFIKVHTIIIFVLNILIYKEIFKIQLEESIIATSLLMLLMFISEFILSLVLILFISMNEIKENAMLNIFLNIIIGLTTIYITSITKIKTPIRQFYTNIKSKKNIGNISFLVLSIIIVAIFASELILDFHFNYNYISNFLTFVILVILTSIFINSKNNYNQLSEEYNTLFSYIQNFEDWIEKEQLNRHEYKNQLAILRSLTDEKTIINKIDEILEDNINIKGDAVHKLKELPKGGLKGLMYYKVAIAQKQKLNIEVDVSLRKRSFIKRLSEIQIKVLCNLIGIYFDNAIEAATETEKKTISLEIYEIKDKVKIVIANTFIKGDNFDKRNERGVTTKGKGHGNGLYYANSLLSKNNWVESQQEIIDEYYVQSIIIKKLDI